MPFDPTLPVNNSPIVAAELRNQLNALKALYDAQQAQIAAMLARWDTLTTQLAGVDPLSMTVSDPPTVNEVQSIAYQSDAMLAAVKAA